MAKVKRGNVLKNRHKKILRYARGFRGSNSKLFISANQTLMKAWRNAFRDRRKRKRDFRRLWIARINAACRSHGMVYSKLINGLTKANIEVNRKMLSEMAIHDKAAFAKLVEIAKDTVEKAAAAK
ncbi:50S ribosomal protein L20 [Candidatus Obscuribacterales bacterium]|jgi:large subunit ribosomal protein L20|nr:50S ribosomal protein L20 [Candidatus Obscuribacterales bacterium]